MKKIKLVLLLLILGGIGMAGNAGTVANDMEVVVIRNVNVIRKSMVLYCEGNGCPQTSFKED